MEKGLGGVGFRVFQFQRRPELLKIRVNHRGRLDALNNRVLIFQTTTCGFDDDCFRRVLGASLELMQKAGETGHAGGFGEDAFVLG